MSQSPNDASKTVPATAPNPALDRVRAIFLQRNYEILSELGRGGMGVVYLARETKLGRRVALKTLAPERAGRENSMKRFEREARTFAQIKHNNIAMLYEFEDEGPIPFLALEFIDGTDLESERRRGRIWRPEEVARILQTLASALDHTHQLGVLHRDIKPGNVLIEKATNRVVLTDFGLAKGRQDDTLTASGFAVGTPAYMAPEQISDQFGIRPDQRSDLFALGILAYEMLTNKHPFLAADDLKTMRNIVQAQPTPLREIDPNIPEPLAQIISDLLEKEPDKRIANAKEVVRRIDDMLSGKTSQPVPAPRKPGGVDTAPQAAVVAPGAAPVIPSVDQKNQAIIRILIFVCITLAALVIGLLIGMTMKK